MGHEKLYHLLLLRALIDHVTDEELNLIMLDISNKHDISRETLTDLIEDLNSTLEEEESKC